MFSDFLNIEFCLSLLFLLPSNLYLDSDDLNKIYLSVFLLLFITANVSSMSSSAVGLTYPIQLSLMVDEVGVGRFCFSLVIHWEGISIFSVHPHAHLLWCSHFFSYDAHSDLVVGSHRWYLLLCLFGVLRYLELLGTGSVSVKMMLELRLLAAGLQVRTLFCTDSLAFALF